MVTPENPYDSPAGDSDDTFNMDSPQSSRKRMLVGFVLGAALPFAVGICLVLQSQIHVGGTATSGYASGKVSLVSLALIFVVSPLLGVICAIASRFLRSTQ